VSNDTIKLLHITFKVVAWLRPNSSHWSRSTYLLQVRSC